MLISIPTLSSWRSKAHDCASASVLSPAASSSAPASSPRQRRHAADQLADNHREDHGVHVGSGEAPKWSPSARTPQRRQTQLITFAAGVHPLIMPNMGILSRRVATMPAAANIILRSAVYRTFINGFSNQRVSTAPSDTRRAARRR